MGIRAEKTGAGIMKEWTRELGAFLSSVGSEKLVLLGVGNPIKSDDSVGLYIADRLRKVLRSSPRLRVRSAPSYPELILSRIDLQSSRLLIFDAVETGRSAGSIVLASIKDTEYGFFATHNLPLKLHPSVTENREKVSVLGVQPGDLGIGEGMNPIVQAAAENVVGEVAKQLRGVGGILV